MRALRVVSRTASSLASRIRGQVAPAPSRAASTLAKQLSYVNGPSTKPLTGKTIGQALDESAARFGERTAIVARQQHVKWTYGELQDQVDRLAASFLRMGLKNGDRLAIWATNCSEWVVIQLATAKAGIISVFLNPAYRPLELAYALNKVECSALVIDRPFKSSNYEAMVREVCPELNDAKLGHLHAKAVPSLRHVVSLAAHHHAGMHRFKDLVGAATPGDVSEMRALADTLDADDAINIQMTSGTTGKPKATVLSHHNILNNAIIVGDRLDLTHEDVIVGNPPLFHCMGSVMSSLNAVERGAALLIPSAGFDAEAALLAAAEEGGTCMMGVPTMFVGMLAALQNKPEISALGDKLRSTLRSGIMAGSICPIELMRRAEKEMNIKRMTICYGMTETSPVSVATHYTDPEWARTETIGRVVPHTEVKIIDPAAGGRVVPRGEKGELCTRGYCVMKGGYWGDEEKTRESIVNGWMHTGDLAQMDADGYIRIVGRIKDMIIRGGENVFPREVEDFLFTHPAVQDCSVYGVADEKMGEEIAVDIILKQSGTVPAPSEHDIKAFCKGTIAHFKVPKYVRFVDDFPKTGSGKIQKFVMRERLEAELKAHKKH